MTCVSVSTRLSMQGRGGGRSVPHGETALAAEE